MAAISAGTLRNVPRRRLARDLGEEALDEVQPGRTRRGEVEMKAWMGGAPRLNHGMLVRSVVAENEVDGLPARGLPLDQVQEGDELGVGVARLTPLDHVALENVEGSK